MFRRLDFGEDGFDFSVRTDDEGGAFGAHVFFSVQAFFHPDAVCVDELMVFVRDQGKRELVVVDELFMVLDGVDADAEDSGLA